MSSQIQIRTVKVELLRTGPSHNQLLSPLTTYLGICDGAEAGVVHVPFEHEAFLRRLREMSVEEDAKDRGPVLRDLGVEIARMLGSIPRLPGSLSTDASGPDTLVHLRLVLSASELALLPFELTKIPIGPAEFAEGWLSLQVRVPVVITRRTRDTPDTRLRWALPPRMLFIAADPVRDRLPFDVHRQALIDAMLPYMRASQLQSTVSDDERREEFADALTILKNASFDDVVKECAQHRYTHIHLLAHGVADENVEERSYGLKLHPAPGHDEVISGDRFASAFATLVDGHIHRPTVVTLATCDSGNAGSVLIPGASLAHVLHQAGIPLVVASQFPLSMPGSELLVQELYPGLLRGDNPLPLLHRIRSEMHGRMSVGTNDWASLVVYEALPTNLGEQLEELRYRQGMRAVHIAFDQLDRAMLDANDILSFEDHRARAARVQSLVAELPMDGRYHLECIGLRAGSSKRLAEASFWAAYALVQKQFDKADRSGMEARDDEMGRHLTDCYAYLEDSLKDYRDAAKGFLRNQSGAAQRVASLHWVLGQQLSLSAVLGVSVEQGTWEAALLSATAYLDDADLDGRRWAHGSLAELWLLKLVDAELLALRKTDPDKAAKAVHRAEREAKTHATELVKLAGSRGDEPVAATLNQLERYTEWWSHDFFEWAADGWPGNRSSKPPSWSDLGVDKLARELIDILENRGRGKRAASVYGPSELPPPTPPTAKAPVALPSAPPVAEPVEFLGKATSLKHDAATGTAFFTIEMLPAGHGDCVWIEYGRGKQTNVVLVDCGTDSTYKRFLKARIERRKQEAGTAGLFFELFILTHIDDDHIGGGIELLKDAKSLGLTFGDVWFNGWKHIQEFLGAVQGEQFSELIEQGGFPWNAWMKGATIQVPPKGPLPTCTLPGGLVLTLLSPDSLKLGKLAQKWNKDVRADKKAKAKGLLPGQGGFLFLGDDDVRGARSDSTDVAQLLKTPFNEDGAPHNGSSITVLAEFAGKTVLLGADVHPLLLAASIERLLRERRKVPGKDKLHLDAFKLPHHGSQNNLDQSVLDLVDCQNYLVSTDGTVFGHPDNEAIARVIQFGKTGAARPKLWFNYESDVNRAWRDSKLQQKYGYDAVYPDQKGQALTIPL